MAGSKQSGEGAVSRARVLGAFIGAKRRPLTRLPRSVHSPAKNGRSPLPLAAGFFWLRFLPIARARVLGAFIGAKRRPLTRLPRSVHSPAKNGRSPLPLAAGFFWLRFL